MSSELTECVRLPRIEVGATDSRRRTHLGKIHVGLTPRGSPITGEPRGVSPDVIASSTRRGFYLSHNEHPQMRTILLAVFATCFVGCSSGGPATTDTSSSSLPTLETKIEFLERHVTFRRHYEELEFHIRFVNGGSFPASPSEWDVRFVAKVPVSELESWVPMGIKPAPTAETNWLTDVPGSLNTTEVTEWYLESRRVVGIDRMRAIAAYRSWSN